MALHEADREDLFAELVAAAWRWELLVFGQVDPLVAGIRADGRFSIFFSPDECYHFDAQNQLRRAYVNGNLYRSQGDTLSELQRQRSAAETTLLRNDLSSDALNAFLEQATTGFTQALEALRDGNTMLLRQVPEEGDHVQMLEQRLTDLLSAPLRLSPAIAPR